MRTTKLNQIQKLVDLYYPSLFQFATRLCGSPVEAMTLTQRTFREAASEVARQLPTSRNNRAWLFALLFQNFAKSRL